MGWGWIATRGLGFGTRQTVSAHFLDKGGAIDAGHASRIGDYAPGLPQGHKQLASLNGCQQSSQIFIGLGSMLLTPGSQRSNQSGQVKSIHRAESRWMKQRSADQNAAQFSDVPGPIMTAKRRPCVVCQSGGSVEGPGHCCDQVGNVFCPLSERGQADHDDCQPVPQIAAELPVRYRRRQVAVRRSDDPAGKCQLIDPANPRKAPFLKNAQQSHLCCGWHVPDFIEQQGSACRLFEPANPTVMRTSKGTPLVAKQLAFYQLGGNGSAIDRNKWPPASRARRMYRAGGHFLAASGRAID